MAEYQRYKCFCCNCVIEAEMCDNPLALSAAYGGLWFRAPGNYGSTIFDLGTNGDSPVSPFRTKDGFLQIVICDQCVKKKAKKIQHVCNIRREETADVREFVI